MLESLGWLPPLLVTSLAITACSGPPREAAPLLHETLADRLGTAPPGTGLGIGDRAPDATLVAITGEPYRLSDAYAAHPVFVVFYRGGWCPYCNLQLHQLTQALPELDRRGVGLVAISVDLPNEEAQTQARQGVAFPILSDPKLVAHRAFNVIHVADDAQQKRLARLGIDLTTYAGETHHSFAIPSIFLVDRAGVIRFVHVDDDYETRPSPHQLLQIADRLLATPPASGSRPPGAP
jgi:peroxiredoxin